MLLRSDDLFLRAIGRRCCFDLQLKGGGQRERGVVVVVAGGPLEICSRCPGFVGWIVGRVLICLHH